MIKRALTVLSCLMVAVNAEAKVTEENNELPLRLEVPLSRDAALSDRLRIRRQADYWETAYIALSVVDAVQTCDALRRGVAVEMNPLIGRAPSCGKIVAWKSALTGIQYLLFSHTRTRHPRAARLAAQLSVGLQGTVVGLNMRYTLRGD